MLSSLKLKLLPLNDCDEYGFDEGRSRRSPHAGHGGGRMAARGDENSIIDSLRYCSVISLGYPEL